MIAWMAILDRLPTKVRLQHMGIVTDGLCVLCKEAQETRNHLFMECPLASSLWKEILLLTGLRDLHCHGIIKCPENVVPGQENQDLKLQWDLSLRVPPRRSHYTPSLWLREEGVDVNNLSEEGRQSMGMELGFCDPGATGSKLQLDVHMVDVEDDTPIYKQKGAKRQRSTTLTKALNKENNLSSVLSSTSAGLQNQIIVLCFLRQTRLIDLTDADTSNLKPHGCWRSHVNRRSHACGRKPMVEQIPTDDVLDELVDTKLQINLEMDKAELYWEQRARKNWLKIGIIHYDVLTAVKSMCLLKASGEDGLGALFHQRFWHLIGPEIVEYCIGLLQGRYDMKEINRTHIILIPKIDSPIKLTFSTDQFV
ncbi:hypothetical protein F3Y22_tig00110300pilonHSYRG00043 [Hibiscus syriacus]|uniref:Reverse transcriptase zinc-binding domain-containing protein n=1 Tax=Hibiscus syriacus TaxID=106335 RepID=A0A6A3B696_HIBSY|nr:hypothetical protein F3Y22_tig00110300pilonHSYRG00043 [Hibiscus syriacus]